MTTLSALIYDLDGTLIDSRKDIATAVNQTLKDFDRDPIANEDIYKFVGKGVIDLIQGTFGSTDPDLVKEVLLKFDEHYTTHCMDESVLYPGAQNLLDWAQSQKMKQAIWTNKPQKWTDPICDHLGLTPLCTAILGADNGYPLKPKVAGTQYLLDELQTDPKKTMMLGDSVVDYKTALNVGMPAMILTHGYTSREILEQDIPKDCLFDCFDDVLEVLSPLMGES